MTIQSGYRFQKKYIFRAGVISLILISAMYCFGAIVFAEIVDVSASNPDYGWFKVESAPQAGEVYFDGQSYGSTPALIKVNTDAPPSHEIVIQMEGYEEFTKEISYNPGKGETVPIVLDATHTLDNIIEFLNES